MRIVCDATLAFIKRCNVLSAIIKMADFCEQHACIKFCLTLILLMWKIRWAPNNASKWQMGFNSAFKGLKLGKTATECYELLKTAFGGQAIGCSQTFQCFFRFKAGRTSMGDDECSGRPVSSSMPEMMERVRQIIREDSLYH